ncbi:hypothetical protein LSTR_LSTR013453 [Laodelphax striatellus]|uniref:Uncharacterized protein n=1 Tax=Laodelphax striatellus TaxID=195883 RepID=A0A482XNS1_LAOST|nr:hypothetical protein LSTR_LSTR013453 [Laodelphax striatellus]
MGRSVRVTFTAAESRPAVQQSNGTESRCHPVPCRAVPCRGSRSGNVCTCVVRTPSPPRPRTSRRRLVLQILNRGSVTEQGALVSQPPRVGTDGLTSPPKDGSGRICHKILPSTRLEPWAN